MTGAVDTVVFDIGNVCVEWDPRALYAKLIRDPARLDWFLKTVVTLDWHTHHDRGRPFSEGVRRLSADYPDEAELIRAFDERWDETITGEIKGTTDLIRQLAGRGVPLYALTNFNDEKFVRFREQYDFVSHFRDVLVSGEVGLVKPDPAIYRLALSRFKRQPEQVLFIDDRIDNVRAAEALGMQGHVFTSPADLKHALDRFGFLEPAKSAQAPSS